MEKNYSTTRMLQHLCKAILMSGEMPELESLKVQDENTILITYTHGGTRPVNVHMDSNIAAMKDVLKAV